MPVDAPFVKKSEHCHRASDCREFSTMPARPGKRANSCVTTREMDSRGLSISSSLQPALCDAFPDHLLLARIDDVDIRRADRVGHGADVVVIERPRAVQAIAIAVVAIGCRERRVRAHLRALVHFGVEVHQQVGVRVDVVIAALLHLVAHGTLEVARDERRVAAAVGAGLLRETEGAVGGEVRVRRRVHVDVRRRVARAACERRERDRAHGERKLEVFHGKIL